MTTKKQQKTHHLTKASAMDNILFDMLKKLRKKIAKEKSLPPAIIFQESSLIDMANNYPINLEEMSQIQGVGIGKKLKSLEMNLST